MFPLIVISLYKYKTSMYRVLKKMMVILDSSFDWKYWNLVSNFIIICIMFIIIIRIVMNLFFLSHSMPLKNFFFCLYILFINVQYTAWLGGSALDGHPFDWSLVVYVWPRELKQYQSILHNHFLLVYRYMYKIKYYV